jgi:hypothetical protein
VGCGAMSLGAQEKYTFLLGTHDPENGVTMIFQNMENYLPITASQPRQLASSLLKQYHTQLYVILIQQSKTLGSHSNPYAILRCFLLGSSIT